MAFFEDEEEDSSANDEHFMWVEKYRPMEFSDYLGNEDLLEAVKIYVETGEIPHMLLHSRSPGTGKTSLAKLLSSKLNADVLYINAADETSIDDVRAKVNTFASTLGFKDKKILILDECQQMSPQAQRALLNIMESTAMRTRFILTCNNIEKLLDPLVSRCEGGVYHVQPPKQSVVAKHVASILDKEGVTYKVADFKILMKFYPDIRRILSCAQKHSITGVLKISEKEIVEGDSKLKLVDILTSKSSKKDQLKDCRQLLANSGTYDYTEYYTFLYTKIDEIAPTATSSLITTLADFEFKDSAVANKEMNFAACLVEIIKIL